MEVCRQLSCIYNLKDYRKIIFLGLKINPSLQFGINKKRDLKETVCFFFAYY